MAVKPSTVAASLVGGDIFPANSSRSLVYGYAPLETVSIVENEKCGQENSDSGDWSDIHLGCSLLTLHKSSVSK